MASPQTAFRAAEEEARANGLHPDVRRLHGWATAVAAYYGYGFADRPDITSGYRSPCEQRELINRWDSGDRAGLRARPAERSWHMNEGPDGEPASLAWDVQTDVQGFNIYDRALRRVNGLKIGGNFGDPGHYALPKGRRPPVADCDEGFFGI